MPYQKVVAIVLGGGRGTRLYPLTEERSKPAVPIAGRYRLVDIPISNCLNAGYNKIFVLTQYNSASLNKHIKNTFNFSAFSNGFVDILAAEQTNESNNWFEGTADAVRRTQKNLLGIDHDYVLILSGDQLYQMDYCHLVDFHVRSKADITLATIPVNAADATGFGILKANKDNEIKSFVEKPSENVLAEWSSEVSPELKAERREYLASMGIYVFSKNILKKLLQDNPGMDFGKHIISDAIYTHRVMSYQFSNYWTDIGTISSFFEANISLTEDIPKFDLFNKPIFTRQRMLPPSKFSGSIIDNSIISEGCIIHAEKINRSIIGVRSRIGKNTNITRTYMMGADYYQSLEDLSNASDQSPPIGVGKNCYIENAILDKNCQIGDNVYIKGGQQLADGDFKKYSIVDGIVIIKKGATIESGFNIS